jgi:hypothetical protein
LHSLVYHPSDIPLKLEISEERVSQFLEKVLGLSAGISTVKVVTGKIIF